MIFRRSTPTLFERAMWDLALGGFVALALLAFLIFGAPAMSASGEPPFTDDQRADLTTADLGGTYLSPSLYRYCGHDGISWYVDSRQGLWNFGEHCTNFMRPRK